MTLFLFGVVLPLLTGFLVVRAIAPVLRASLQVCLAAGMGIGIISCCFFLSLRTGVPAIFLEVALVAVVLATGFRRLAPRARAMRPNFPPNILDWILGVAFGAVILCAMSGFIKITRSAPHGEWDAWAIWNLHARFLMTAYWRDLFSTTILWTHPDYPLLLPGFIASVWRATHERELIVSAATAFVFTFGTIGVLVGSLAALKSRAQGLLAGMLLAGTPFFIAHGAAQYADVPVSFFILATLALLALQDRYWPAETGLSVLAGLSAGMAAWTKNEGLLLVAVVVAVHLIVVARSSGVRQLLRQAGWFAAGLAPVMAIVLYCRHTLATPNTNLSGHGQQSLTALATDPDRWGTMIKALFEYTATFGGLYVSVCVVLGIYLLCVGLDYSQDRAGVQRTAGTLFLMIAGYCSVCVITPVNITWEISTALNRLILQLWPATLFLAFLAAPIPDAQLSSLLSSFRLRRQE
jgi:hypothetical protein